MSTNPRHPEPITDDTESRDMLKGAIATGDELHPDQYPRMWNASAAFFYKRIVRPRVAEPPEFVTVPVPSSAPQRTHTIVAISQWNLAWEAAQYRRRLAPDDLPPAMYTIADRGDINIVFVPRTTSRYYEYALLYHLLPSAALQRHGLPLLHTGQWPFLSDLYQLDRIVPHDMVARLSAAWSSLLWPRLMGSAKASAFSAQDPIRILAQDLDYWIPPVTHVAEGILRDLPLVDEDLVDVPAPLENGETLPDALAGSPGKGGDLWRGQAEAAEVLDWAVEVADSDGRLRATLDAVRSHRVQDDFSRHWSRAREDFERKLNHKRSRISVRFVELPHNLPFQSPETEVEDALVFRNFLTLLNQRERQVVVLLSSGMTKVGEVATALGYANHSPVSKRLARIRAKAREFFDQTA